ncbi:MAG TPA: adenylate/guanylate cyclase domain-containing protein [Candidatus Limnocylindrales bacterium]
METVACPSCGEENPAKFRLCGFCGTSLVPVPETIICSGCGEENPSKFRLCGFCGTPLAAGSAAGAPIGQATAPPVQAPPAAPPAGGVSLAGTAAGDASPFGSLLAPAPARPAATTTLLPAQEVRKFVTLVFTDLKDSTALTASIDAEAMNEIKARYFSSMAAEIERHGGKVEKNIGDAIMAVFGRVRAREDDALRAVLAASGMVSKLHELNEEFARLYGVQLTVRTGVNTGEVVANTDENATMNLATGDAVNVAARLEQNAPANEVLMGEVTYELVRDYVQVERLELMLKGKTEPVPAYRLMDVRAQPIAKPSAVAAPFVGREAEMDLLRGAFAEVGATRSARLVTVIGDAGVGKTRLISDFIGRVQGEASVLRGRCLAYGDGITFWPLVEIVRSAAKIGEDDSQETARGRIAALLPADDPDRAAVVDRVASAVGLSSVSHPVAELFWGVRKLLEAQAAERPLVMLIDDIHSAEATFLDLLEHLVESVRDAPILILCSARPELADVYGEWLASAGVERIDLAPLGATDVEAMIDRLLVGVDVAPETRDKVIAAAEGNPLYIEQIVTMLRERDPGGDVVVPPTISALLAARLDGLSRQERAVVDPAAVIGLVFPAAAIAQLVPELIRPEVGDHLSALDRKQFVHPLTTDADDEAYRFHHILVRDAAYQSLLKRARATLHERFVEWAEPVNRERGRETEFEEILGYHLEQAVRYRSELGPLDEQGRAVALRASTKLAATGRRAFNRGDIPAACNLLRRAAALLPTEDPGRVELLAELADALTEEGRFEEAREVISEGSTIAQTLGDARLRARVALAGRGLRLQLSQLEGGDQAIADTMEAIRIFEDAGDTTGLARAWRLVMVIHGVQGAYDQAASAAQSVFAYAKAAGDQRAASRGAMGYATTALNGPTPVAEAIATCDRLVAEVKGDRKAESVILVALAQLRAMACDFEEARSLYRRAATMLAELGPSVTSSTLSIETSRVEALAGDFQAAADALRRDDAALADMGERLYRSTVDALLAHVLVTLGEYGEAAEISKQAEALADADDVESQVIWRLARGRALAKLGNAAEAEAYAREAVELARPTVIPTLLAGSLADLAEVLRTLGRNDEAGPPLREALDLYDRKGDAASVARIRRLLAEPAGV